MISSTGITISMPFTFFLFTRAIVIHPNSTPRNIFVVLLQTVRYAIHPQTNDVPALKSELSLFHLFHLFINIFQYLIVNIIRFTGTEQMGCFLHNVQFQITDCRFCTFYCFINRKCKFIFS